MADEQKTKLRLEIAHVLFVDIVGYSKLLLKQQGELSRELNEMVSATNEFREADAEGKLIRLPTGDGMALVFRSNPDAAAQCAVEISKALKSYPNIQLRMGVHSGPVSEVLDVNQRANIAGAGINMAQRVMDCGDAGHILLSKHVAEDLEQDEDWRPRLHDLGECEVKHGVRVHLFNLYGEDFGNRAVPLRVQSAAKIARKQSRVRWLIGATFAALALCGLVVWQLTHRTSPRPPMGAPEKSIAVLPFENLSSDKENAYFADGVQDEILTDLAKIADLKVISRSSVMHYKSGVERNLRKIGQELGVAVLLEGSVQRVANRIRVNAQLIDAQTDAHLWAQTYDRELADVFAIQSEIAKTIADQLQAKISPGEKAAIAQPPTMDLTANALYTQAIALESKEPEEPNLREGVRLLEEAVVHDPHFLLAYCALGRMHLILFFGGYDHTPARRELANAATQNAVRLQPDAGETHLALARYAYHGFRDYDRARAELDLARGTLPNDVDVFYLTALIDRRQGRWAEATGNFDRAIALDPRNVKVLDVAADTYRALHRYSESNRLFQRALAISPSDHNLRLGLAELPFSERGDIRPLRTEVSAILAADPKAVELTDILLECALIERDAATANRALAAIPPNGVLGRGNLVYPREWFAGLAARTSFTAARASLEKVVRDQPDYAPALSLLGRIDAALGQKEEAMREGRRACELVPLSKDAALGQGLIVNLAIIYAWIGEKDLALETLAAVAQLANPVHYGFLKLDPTWDPLRGDPRFEKIVASLAPK